MNRIVLDVVLSGYANNQIEPYSSNTIISFIDSNDYAIDPTLVFGNIVDLKYGISPVSLDSSIVFGESQLNTSIFANSIESTVEFANIDQIKQNIIVNSVNSTLVFGDAKLIASLSLESIESTAVVSNVDKLSFIVKAESISSTAIFGWDDPLLNMQIRNFESIESTIVIPEHAVRSVLRPLGINTTVNFGLPTFTDNIHRLLLFKDDNITKVGEFDAVVIAGGIRINSSLAKSNSAESGEAILPSNPVGFISVNIDGNDYKIPYYN